MILNIWLRIELVVCEYPREEYVEDLIKSQARGLDNECFSFETGGRIILSYEPEVKSGKKTNERETFDKANLETIKGLLKDISPEKQLTEIY